MYVYIYLALHCIYTTEYTCTYLAVPYTCTLHVCTQCLVLDWAKLASAWLISSAHNNTVLTLVVLEVGVVYAEWASGDCLSDAEAMEGGGQSPH